jgi:hypothetical protein
MVQLNLFFADHFSFRTLAVTLIALLVPALPLQADMLLDDQHGADSYLFESDAADVAGTIDQAQATFIGIKWAMLFYNDLFLTTLNCEYRLKPIRFWLVSFAKGKEKFFAVVLPGRLNRRTPKVAAHCRELIPP